jgi:hypothetical protein
VTTRIVRDQVLAKNIVIVDGMSKSGKSLVCPLISSLSKGELWQFDHIFEYVATFRHFGKIDENAAASLIKLYADFNLYNVMIGRNTNFRKKDPSSASANLLDKRQRKRLTGAEGKIIVNQIQKKNPILVLMVHYVFKAYDVFFSAFQERLKLYIISLRHPAWLIASWHERDWNSRFNIDPRDFQICVEVKGKTVPWFAVDNPGRYLSLGPLEQSIYVVNNFTNDIEKKYEQVSADVKKNVMFIPFEPFMVGPLPYIREIAKRTKSKLTEFTRAMLKRMNLPRPFDVEQIKNRRNQMGAMLKEKKVSEQMQSMFHSLCDNYENKYLTNKPFTN